MKVFIHKSSNTLFRWLRTYIWRYRDIWKDNIQLRNPTSKRVVSVNAYFWSRNTRKLLYVCCRVARLGKRREGLRQGQVLSRKWCSLLNPSLSGWVMDLWQFLMIKLCRAFLHIRFIEINFNKGFKKTFMKGKQNLKLVNIQKGF